MKKKTLILVFSLPLIFLACSGKEEIEKWPTTGDYYDPGKPVAINELIPAWGGIDQTFVIKGNFPKDTAQLKVYFGDRKAVLLNCDGNSLTGMIPKQLPGYNQLSVVVGKETIVPDDIQFKYYQTQSIKTLVGAFRADQYLAGSFGEARISWPTNLGTVKGQKGDNVIAVEGEWNSRISLISNDDNTMIQIADVGWPAGPAVDNTRETFYVMHRTDRLLYRLSRADGWMTQLVDIRVPWDAMPGDLVGGNFAFTEDDRYLYMITSQGYFGRIDLEEKTYKVLLTTSDFNWANSWWTYMTYSKFHKCFFVSFENQNGIYKVSQDTGGNWKSEKYAGFNGGNMAFGHRLNDAQLQGPQGLAVTALGDIYVVCRYAHCIVKITGDIVSLVAGKPGTYGTLNGDPLDALLDQPLAIVTDSDDNFYISGGADRTIRKLTIE